MRRYISIILIILCFFVLNNLFAYTSSDNKQISYILELNKSGVNKIYFAESATIETIDEEVHIISTPLSNNRLIFPLLSNSKDTLSDNLFFVWELDDATGAEISLKFVSSDTDFNTGYMLQNVNDKYSTDSSKSNDFNYSVSVYEKDTTTNPVGSIVVGHDTVLLSRDISKRTIKVYPAVNSKKSYVRINMEVLAPKWGEGGIAFMDAQYAGYIVAELKFN